MGYAVGEKFTRAANRALEQKCPMVCFSATGGARMQEALISLMQMAKTSAVLEKMKAESLPYISVMTDPVYGGVSASLALLGDINIAEPNARAGFAGPNIIEQTIRQKLPKGFQRSEFLLERGEEFWTSQYESDPVPLTTRYEVLKRAGKRCELCGVAEGDEAYEARPPLHIDHITPRSKGGSNDLDNLQVLCRACNLGKGNRDDTDFR